MKGPRENSGDRENFNNNSKEKNSIIINAPKFVREDTEFMNQEHDMIKQNKWKISTNSWKLK